jgi:hypothetical protein
VALFYLTHDALNSLRVIYERSFSVANLHVLQTHSHFRNSNGYLKDYHQEFFLGNFTSSPQHLSGCTILYHPLLPYLSFFDSFLSILNGIIYAMRNPTSL